MHLPEAILQVIFGLVIAGLSYPAYIVTCGQIPWWPASLLIGGLGISFIAVQNVISCF